MVDLKLVVRKWVIPAAVYGIIYSISAFYSFLAIGRFLYRWARNPSDHFWKVKARPVPPEALNDPALGNHSYIQLENVKLHYVEAGDREKPLMLFLHGFPEFWYSWRHQLKEFSQDYWTIAVDLRGYGDSEKPVGIKYYRMKYLVQDVKNLISALGKEKCILVAHDWGGVIGWYFVQLYPECIETYIMLNAPHPLAFRKQIIKSLSQFRKSWYIFFFQAPYLPEFMLRIKDMAFIKNVFKSGKTPNPVTEDDVEAYKFTFGKPGAFTYPVNYYRMNIMPDWRLLKKRRTDVKLPPGLLLFGDADTAIEVAVVEGTRRIVHNLTAEIIPGGSHFIQQDEPTRVNEAIRQFLKAGYEPQVQ